MDVLYSYLYVYFLVHCLLVYYTLMRLQLCYYINCILVSIDAFQMLLNGNFFIL